MQSPPSAGGELAAFAADALDWPAVRERLAEHAASAIGRRALGALTPRGDEEARLALARTGELLELSAQTEPPLAGAPDPGPELAAAARYGRTLEGGSLNELARFLRVVEDIEAWLAGRRTELVACTALTANAPDLRALRERLEREVDRHGKVQDDATPTLKGLRGEIARLARELDAAVHELAHRPNLRGALAEGHVGQVHRRGRRRVLAVRQRHAGQVPGIVHDRSQSGETVFVEPRDLVESGNLLAALEADAEREVSRILAELTRQVLRRRDAIEDWAERVGELELAWIGARYARATHGCVPRVPGDPGAAAGLVLRGWRHPLLLAGEGDVTPIDVRLGEEFDLVVVTGPNTGGKTLALKGAGLAALLTRMGLSLPCSPGSTVPLYDGIVADIGDEQEIEQSLSTFSSHMVRVRAGLERAGPRTLCLIDELGGGTDPMEGAALGEAILERLLALRAPTLASTHLGKLKEFAFRFERAENAHVEFDLETLAPRYTLVIGAPGESRALAIARRLGLPAELIDRAAERLERPGGEAEGLMADLRGVRLDAERARREVEARTVELERRLAASDEQRAALDERAEQLEAEAQRGLEERLAAARPWLERARSLLPRLPAALRGEAGDVLGELEASLAGASLTDRRRSFLEGLDKGDTVWLPRFKKRCTVARIFKDRRELAVRLGKRELRVAFDDVTFYESL